MTLLYTTLDQAGEGDEATVVLLCSSNPHLTSILKMFIRKSDKNSFIRRGYSQRFLIGTLLLCAGSVVQMGGRAVGSRQPSYIFTVGCRWGTFTHNAVHVSDDALLRLLHHSCCFAYICANPSLKHFHLSCFYSLAGSHITYCVYKWTWLWPCTCFKWIPLLCSNVCDFNCIVTFLLFVERPSSKYLRILEIFLVSNAQF